MKFYLAISFGWISLVFFLTLGKGLAGSAFFAALFMVIAILFAVDSLRQRMEFRLPGGFRVEKNAMGLLLTGTKAG